VACLVERALSSDPAHLTAVVRRSSGLLGVHVADVETGDLAVVSVIADPALSRRDVLHAAHEVAVQFVLAGAMPGAVDPFDLPLGDGPAWSVTETTGPVTSADGRGRGVRATMPAWSAGLDLDLLQHAGLGFGDAGATLVRLLQPLPAPRVDARQVARARYTASGFEAAAITALAVAAGAMIPRHGVRREVEVRFGHPYAVVAVARQPHGPWHGLPVFSAWVAEPAEAHEPEIEPWR
jgi:hypothetical protein